jgi:hypothetical protein
MLIDHSFIIYYIMINELKGQNWTMQWPLQIDPAKGERIFVHDSTDYLRHVSIMNVPNVIMTFYYISYVVIWKYQL